MPDPTYYCVQVFKRDGRRLSADKITHYPTAEEAGAEAARAALRSAGAVAFEMTGRPELDIWGEARLIAVHGDIPRVV